MLGAYKLANPIEDYKSSKKPLIQNWKQILSLLLGEHFVHAVLSIFEHVLVPTAITSSSHRAHTECRDFMIAGVQKKEISSAAPRRPNPYL
jgi:hypothetical protein